MLPGTSNDLAKEFIAEIYRSFNAREIDDLLALMTPGRGLAERHGRRLRDRTGGDPRLWIRQWTMIDPKVTPKRVDGAGDGRVAVLVRQVIRDLGGQVLRDGPVTHLYTLRGFRVVTMEIRHEAD